MAEQRPRVLGVRLDGLGDVLLTGPALRQLAAGASRLDVLVSPEGAPGAGLLPGVDGVLVHDAPWTGTSAPPVDAGALDGLVTTLRARRYDVAVIFTSYHQSSLPMALLAKWAGIPTVVATSDDYPGSLLDVRHRRFPTGDDTGEGGNHETDAACALATAAGFPRAPGDDGRLRLVPVTPLRRAEPYVVVHPAASVPSRSPGAEQTARIVRALARDGWDVLLTGAAGDAQAVGGAGVAVDLRGRTTVAELAGVLAGASCVVAPNTGPAHLAAALGTPVVCLFSPVVPAERWAPRDVPVVLLGDQAAPCRATRARTCPVPGHPCLDGIAPQEVVGAVRELAGGTVPTGLRLTDGRIA